MTKPGINIRDISQRILTVYKNTNYGTGKIISPLVNLPHYSNSCHFNTIIQMISSCKLLMDELIKYDNFITYFLLPFVDITGPNYQVVAMTLLNTAASSLGINIISADYAPDTAKKVINKIKDITKTNLIYYWDTSQDIDKLNTLPVYLVANLSDINVVNDKRSTKIQSTELSVGNTKYNLSSLIVYNFGHYVMVQVGNSLCKLYDDLHYKRPIQQFHINNLTRFGTDHVLGLYVKA